MGLIQSYSQRLPAGGTSQDVLDGTVHWKDPEDLKIALEIDQVANIPPVNYPLSNQMLVALNRRTVLVNTVDDLRNTDMDQGMVFFITELGKEGFWYWDQSDTTSADNTGTILVSYTGKRYKRYTSGEILFSWFDQTNVGFQNFVNASENLTGVINKSITLTTGINLKTGRLRQNREVTITSSVQNLFTATSIQNLYINDFKISYTPTVNNSKVFNFIGCSRVYVQNVNIAFGNSAFSVTGVSITSTSDNIQMNNIKMDNSLGMRENYIGFVFADSSYISVINSYIRNVTPVNLSVIQYSVFRDFVSTNSATTPVTYKVFTMSGTNYNVFNNVQSWSNLFLAGAPDFVSMTNSSGNFFSDCYGYTLGTISNNFENHFSNCTFSIYGYDTTRGHSSQMFTNCFTFGSNVNGRASITQYTGEIKTYTVAVDSMPVSGVYRNLCSISQMFSGDSNWFTGIAKISTTATEGQYTRTYKITYTKPGGVDTIVLSQVDEFRTGTVPTNAAEIIVDNGLLKLKNNFFSNLIAKFYLTNLVQTNN